MKKIYFLFFFYISFNFLAQIPYELFNSKSEFFFIKSNLSELTGLKTDSAKVVGLDTVYYHYRILATSSGTCYANARSISWLGNKTIRTVNSDYIFFNQQNDSIIIKPLSSLNSSWIYYKYANGNYIKATIISQQYESTFNGSSDTVKTISFMAFDNLNNAIGNLYNNKTFKIARTQGIIKLGDIYNFPTDTAVSHRCFGKRLTMDDVYGHNIGDILQTYHYNGYFTQGPPSMPYSYEYATYLYLTKTTPTVNSSVYTVSLTTDAFNVYPPTPTYTSGYTSSNHSTSIQTITINNLDSLVIKQMPQQYNASNLGPNYSSGSAINYSYYGLPATNDCGRLRIDFSSGSEFFGQSDTCLGVPEADDFITIYMGLGNYLHTDQAGYPGDPREDYYPIYFSSANCTFGTYYPVGIKEYALKPNLQLSPNPAHENLNFELSTPQKISEVTITNILGKIVLTEQNPEGFFINVSNLTNGIYFVKIKTVNGEVTEKFIKE